MLDELHTVGPGGHFMHTEQTLARFRDFWYPGLLDRSIRPTWLAAGGETLGERLNKRVLEIIEDHRPAGLEPDIKQKISEILGQAG
jgi:trimethylamine--corrinoid protein Co-methyltransferase